MLSDDTKRKYMPTPKRRAEGNIAYRRRFSDSQKIEAVTTYLMLGSLTLVSAVLKININTLKVWKKSEWWKDVERDLRTQEDLQLSKRLQNIVTKSLDVVEDRMEHGDFVYDQKTGKMKRKPVNMRDAAKVMLDLQERQEVLIDRHITNESISTDKVEQTLSNLAKEFARIATQVTAKPAVEVTDVLFGEDSNAPEKP
jgi:transposase-like protein